MNLTPRNIGILSLSIAIKSHSNGVYNAVLVILPHNIEIYIFRYGSFSQIQPYLSNALSSTAYQRDKTRVLVIGCGNSDFSHELYLHSQPHIINIDFSPIVIEEMKRKAPHLTWEVMDMTKLAYANSSFDVVVDKGSLDALLSTHSKESSQDSNHMFNHISRVLDTSGCYICISLAQDYILHTLLSYFNQHSNFTIEVYRLDALQSNPLVPFIFLITKTVLESPREKIRLYFDTLGNKISTPQVVTVEEAKHVVGLEVSLLRT